MDEVTRDCFLEAMSGELEAVGFRTGPGFDGLDVRGTLWGGNLCMVSSLLGTPHWPRIKGGVLFLEDVNEHPYRIERMLLQLHQAGVLDAQKAILLGAFTDCRKSPLDRGYTLKHRDRPRAQRHPHAHPDRAAVRPCADQGLPAGGPTRRAAGAGAGRARGLVRATQSKAARGNEARTRTKPALTSARQGGRMRGPRMSSRRWKWAVPILGALSLLTACNNSPYPDGAAATNTLFNSFDERSPRYLDPTASYSNPETPYTYSVVRAALRLPLSQAALHPDPQDGRGRGQAAVPRQGRPAAARRRASRSDCRERVRHPAQDGHPATQPHPAFAKDDKGEYLYHALKPGEVGDKRSPWDFEQQGTRELVAEDYVYAFKRHATTRIEAPHLRHLLRVHRSA